MKKIIYLLLALLSIIYVSSCSKSDDIENNADIPNTNNFKVVDLGLPSGLKWASCNLGASKPEELGSLYAWGELSEKEEYTSTNAKWYGRSTSALKSDKIIDYNGNLTPENDVVTVKLGEKWRMPTNGEKLELAEYCIWSTSKLNGVSGLLITGPNGNSIFFPSSSYYRGAHYGWTSTACEDGIAFETNKKYSYSYNIAYGDGNTYTTSNMLYRYYACPVRPVTE